MEGKNAASFTFRERACGLDLIMMKIAIVSPCFGTLGGIETYVCALARELAATPGVVVTLCFKKTKGFKLDPMLEKIARESGAEVVFPDRASRDLVSVIRNADVVHCQNACIDVAVIAKCFRKPLVLTIHNYRIGGWHPRELLRTVAYALADRRWYNSGFVWDTWEPRGRKATSERMPVVSNLPTGVVPPERRKGFVFIARWIPNKGIDILVDAYAQATLDRNEWPLILMGDGPMRPVIEEKIRAGKIEGIEIRGRVEEAVRNEVIRHARWMVTPPNTREDMGLTPIEARHVGVPCIITRDGGLPEAGGKHALSCEPGNVGELKALLEQAAHMDSAEYGRRALDTRAELLEDLKPLSIYLDRYREVLK